MYSELGRPDGRETNVARKKWATDWTFEADDDFHKLCVLLQDTYTLTLIPEYPNAFSHE
jgi:hypothetical protein